MKATLKNCLIAQNYSDAAKNIDVYPNELHYKQINKIIDNDDSWMRIKDKLYWNKSYYLFMAFKSAKREKIPVFYDEIECCVYFEFPFGQCSFHYFDDDFTKNVKIVENYQWSGMHNTRELLIENYKQFSIQN